MDKWENEELAIDYSFSCQYVVSADISACFPSIYSHSIPWAIKGKEWAKNNNYAVVNYAIKLIAGKNLTLRAKRLYIKKILQIALNHPYLLPLTEKYVFTFAEDIAPFLNSFLPSLFKKVLDLGTTDSLSFLFYYAVKYDLKINFTMDNAKEIIVLNDCISMLLAYKYVEKQEDKDILNLFYEHAKKIIKFTKREQDQYWLFLYEILEAKHLDGFYKKLNEENIRFYDIEYGR